MNGSPKSVGEIILTVLAIIAVVVGFGMWGWRAHDKKALALRLGGTLFLSSIMFLVIVPTMKNGPIAQIAGVLFTVGWGWAMAIIWVPAFTSSVGRLFGSFYDGGSAEVDPKPFYSIFHAKRMKGKYQEALTEVRRQLDRFPTDFEGMVLLAELQAENLNDLAGAEITIQRLCSQPGHAPKNISHALNRLADWHLSLHKDRDAAQRDLEKIIELLPDTEMSLQAAQRIGRLADTESLLASHDRQRISVKKGVENLGLLREHGKLRPPETDHGQEAADYVDHLERHPHDSHAREKLAVIYAGHYHRLDLAMDQLEQLIQQPNQPVKQVVHWLNLMADLQVQEGADLEQVRQTLQRIRDLYPDIAAAETARRRMDTLKLEVKAKEKRQGVQLGTYEQNLGLKKGES